MTLRSILIMPAILALLTPLQAQNPEFDWNVLHRRVADLLQHGFTDEAETVLQDGIRAARGRNDASEGLAASLNDLGSLCHDSGRLVDADRAYHESLSIWRRVDATNPKLAITLGNLAGLRLAQGRPSDAEKLYLEAQHLFASAYGAENPEVASVLSGLADVYWETGKYHEARVLAERAVSFLDGAGDDPAIGRSAFHPRKDCLETG